MLWVHWEEGLGAEPRPSVVLHPQDYAKERRSGGQSTEGTNPGHKKAHKTEHQGLQEISGGGRL